MKCIVILMLGVIIISNERESKLTTSAQTKNSKIAVSHYESIVKDLSQEENSVLSGFETLESASEVIAQSDKQKLLLPSKSVIDEYYSKSSDIFSESLSNSVDDFIASTSSTGTSKTVVIENDQTENANESNQFIDSLHGQEHLISMEPLIEVQTHESDVPEKVVNGSDTVLLTEQEKTKKMSPQHEDIPSFSEWTQKQLAEAEKKKTDQNETTDKFAKGRGKYRTKNYASPDCGAKIVAANPESVSSSSVLSSLKDEYMLNYCTNRIWFIVELCEAIQAKQLDLANFELFSSSPKHFSVLLSHRFPTREWSNVGKFSAEDSRDVQTFNLHPHLFGKFVKIEMHSHYGREQFCPISWVGVYGTSEYEVLAKEDERNLVNEDDYGDSYDEEIFLGHKRHSPKNLFSSATEAVLSIVKKATAPFMKSENNETESENCTKTVDPKSHRCFSPRYIIVCNNCSQTFYDEVFHFLSCEWHKLMSLISNFFVRQTLMSSEICVKFGLDFRKGMEGAPYSSKFLRTSEQGVKYLTVMLKNTFIAALCNALAVSENKVVLNNTALNVQSLKNLTKKEEYCKENGSADFPRSETSVLITSSCKEDECINSSSEFQFYISTAKESVESSSFHSSQIQPTKTIGKKEAVFSSSPTHFETHIGLPEDKITEPSSDEDVSSSTLVPEDKGKIMSNASLKKEKKNLFAQEKDGIQKEVEPEKTNSNEINQDSTTLESIISDLNAIERVASSHLNTFTPSNLPAESIFLRLANRIKNLEINMSLSSTYLEELSRRYRTQFELLSKSLNGTIQKLEEYSKAEEEKDRRREKEMLLIRMQLANLTRDVSAFILKQNSWRPQVSSAGQHILFITLEFLLIWLIFNYWRKSGEGFGDEKSHEEKKLNKKFQRRISLEGVKGHEIPKKKTRRPSEEALDIALSRTYKGGHFKVEKKRKKRKKDSKCSLNGFQPQLKMANEKEYLEKRPWQPAKEESVDSTSLPEEYNMRNGQRGFGSTKEIVSALGKSSSATGAKSLSQGEGKTVNDLAPPTFIKTALAVRNTRMRERECSQNFKADYEAIKKITHKERKGSNSIKKYMKKFF